MTIVNHEAYVSLEIAKLLKEAGFDWKVDTLYFSMQDDDYPIKEELIKCTDYFPNGDQRGTRNIFHNWNQLNTKRGGYYTFVSKKNFLEFDYEIIKKDTTLISVPTLEVAQRWLREVENIAVYVCPSYELVRFVAPNVVADDEKWLMKWQVAATHYDIEADEIGLGDVKEKCFDTYEEAQEAGIKKVLEIILEK